MSHKPNQLVKDYQEALNLLKEGNKRYLDNNLVAKDTYDADRKLLSTAQLPFAVVVACSDSRVAPEIFFDQKLGDIFVIRNAGNVIDQTTLGSIEYAVEHLHSPLVVVCGHKSCGAVTAACSDIEGLPENIKSIVDRMKESVAKCDNIDDTIKQNAIDMAEKVKEDEIVKHENVAVVGAYYNIETGEVVWL